MPDTVKLEKAQLWELLSDCKTEKPGGKRVTVQFNPETLKVSFANQIATPEKAGDQKGTPTMQYVGAGTTKLALQLWFDVTAPIPEGANPPGGKPVKNVRKLTQEVAYFITAAEVKNKKETKYIPPGVRFLWGSFQFEGVVESMEESLEFFSSEGIPLRASVSLALTQQKITEFKFRDTGKPPGNPAASPVGTQPLTQAPANSTLQGLAVNLGLGDIWQLIAEANGIENPRLLQAGQMIDMGISVTPPSAGAGITTQSINAPAPAVRTGASGAGPNR